MTKKLNIYACSGIGNNGEINTDVTYNTFGTNTLDNTQAVNTIISYINYNQAVCNAITTSYEERVQLMNDNIVHRLCLQAITERIAELPDLKAAISDMVEQGLCSIDTDDQQAYDSKIEETIAYLRSHVYDLHEKSNTIFNRWWDNNVADRDIVGIPDAERMAIRKAIRGTEKVSGDEWKENKDLSELLTKGSEFFLYLYFTDEQLKKLPKVFREKRAKQTEIYYDCKNKFVPVYGSEKDLQRIISAGIYQYFGASPKDVCEDIANGKRVKGVGQLSPLIIVAIIEAIVSLVIAAMQLVIQAIAASKEAKYEQIREETLREACADSGDFSGFDLNGNAKKYLLWILGGLGLLYFIKNQ